MKKFILLIWVLFLFAGSISLDWFFTVFSKFRGMQDPLIPYGAEIAVYIPLAFILLLLARKVLYQNSRSLFIAVVFMVIGGFVVYAASIAGLFALGSRIPWNHIWYSEVAGSRFGFTRMSGAMVFVIGLLRLLPDTKLWPEKFNH
jgi:hypothetical protein